MTLMKTDRRKHSNVIRNARSNPLKRDPTRTTMLRNAFIRDMNKRLRQLKRAIRTIVVDRDVFGLRKNTNPFAANAAPFGFDSYGFDQIVGISDPNYVAPTADFLDAHTPAAQVEAFQDWFNSQIESGLLATTGDPLAPWTHQYITSAYKQAAVRTYNDIHGLSGVLGPFAGGSQAGFLATSFGGPIGIKQIQLLGTRAFSQLKGVTAAMEQQMSRVLADGLAHGLGAQQIANNLNKTVSTLGKNRSMVIARTEIIHSYAEGQLDSYEALNMDGVSVMAEWSTAGDDRVCAACSSLEGVTLKVEEARGLIPRHPNCRCAFIPANVGETPKEGQPEQITDPEEIEQAFEDSIMATVGEGTPLGEAIDKSTWRGAGRKTVGKTGGAKVNPLKIKKTIDKDRPNVIAPDEEGAVKPKEPKDTKPKGPEIKKPEVPKATGSEQEAKDVADSMDDDDDGWIDIENEFRFMDGEQPYDVAGAEFLQEGTVVRIKISDNRYLIATQNLVNKDRVKLFIDNPLLAAISGDQEDALPKIFLHNNKYYIHDGHHRMFAASLEGKDYVDVVLLVDPKYPGSQDLSNFLFESELSIMDILDSHIAQ